MEIIHGNIHILFTSFSGAPKIKSAEIKEVFHIVHRVIHIFGFHGITLENEYLVDITQISGKNPANSPEYFQTVIKFGCKCLIL